jgi:hypothetical protein
MTEPATATLEEKLIHPEPLKVRVALDVTAPPNVIVLDPEIPQVPATKVTDPVPLLNVVPSIVIFPAQLVTFANPEKSKDPPLFTITVLEKVAVPVALLVLRIPEIFTAPVKETFTAPSVNVPVGIDNEPQVDAVLTVLVPTETKLVEVFMLIVPPLTVPVRFTVAPPVVVNCDWAAVPVMAIPSVVVIVPVDAETLEI